MLKDYEGKLTCIKDMRNLLNKIEHTVKRSFQLKKLMRI